MHTIDIILKRRSIRKFKDKQVPWDNIVSLINCAINTPAAGNLFNVKFIVIRELGNRKSIAAACHNQLWIASAPAIIAVVAEAEQQKKFYGLRGEKLYTIQNAAACAMNIIIAAESLGLGTCWVGAFDEDKLRDALGLAEDVNVHVILALGFADESPIPPPKPVIKTVLSIERWLGGRKFPSYGYYSENVMKMTKLAGEQINKAGKDASDAITKLKEKVLGKREEK